MDPPEFGLMAIGCTLCGVLAMAKGSAVSFCTSGSELVMSMSTTKISHSSKHLSELITDEPVFAEQGVEGDILPSDRRASKSLGMDGRCLELDEEDQKKYNSFKYRYLGAFLTAMFADWMKGAYVYALYSRHYNYDMREIGQLFIAGFGSSLIFGTYVGSLTDRVGRRNTCRLYCILYILACILKNWRDFRLLLIGRVLAGISTSILYTGFESWCITEFRRLNLPHKMLRDLFQKATFYNAFTAIIAGFTADFVARTWSLVAPFNAAIIPLVISLLIIQFTWRENYGDQMSSVNSNLYKAISAMKEDRKILFIGIISGLFEGVMYVFVFMWTPALEASKPAVSHGIVFAIFMVWKMCGSYAFMTATEIVSPHDFSLVFFSLASACMLVPVFTARYTEGWSYMILFTAFCLYECCIGMYFPTLAMMRTNFIDDKIRSTTMNLFRVPLNIIVMLTLTNIGDISQEAVFLMCTIGLLASTVVLKFLCSIVVADNAKLRILPPRSIASQ